MPPSPLSPLDDAETQTLRTWLESGVTSTACSSDGGVHDAGAPADARPDPFAVPPRCTSAKTWTGGTRESPLMQPGEPCVACHAKPGGEAPRLAFGGTLYPSAHEPSQCYGADGTASAKGAQVVIIDAKGMTFTADVNAAGNFFLRGNATLVPPIKAKVVYMGRERAMVSAVPSGDCNACHTQAGTTTEMGMDAVKAPGRIILP
jgi:hypothetical protein